MSRAFLCLVAFIAIPAAAAAQTPARDTPAPLHGAATIRGRVLDAGTGRPLSRVEVRAGSGQGPVASGLTDGEGKYDLADLPAGTYTVIATKANYVRTAWGEQRPEGPGKRIAIADGQHLENINLSLKRGGVVTGRIVDEFGDPVTDVTVTAMRYQYIQGSRRLVPGGRFGQTNDIGEYRIYGLSPGQYFVSATLRNQMGPMTDVVDRAGYAPTFYPGTGNVAEAQRVTIAAGQTLPNITLSLLPIRTVKVSGVALDSDGKPLVNGMVAVMQRLIALPMGVNMAPVKPDGTFVLTNLTPGDYTLRTNAPNGDSATVDITVTGVDLSDLVLVVTKPSIVRGRIVFVGGADATAPPVPTTLDLGAWREWALAQPVRIGARIKDDGTFEMSVAPGHVQVRVAPTPANADRPWRLNRVLLNGVDVGDSGIDVPPNGTIENVTVEMTNHIGEASGRVTDADGNLVRDCFVIVFAQDPARWTIQTRYLSASRPALDDLYHAQLLPGDYYAIAMNDVEANAWTDAEFLAQVRDRAAKFSIADGESKTLDLRLTPVPQM
jgi:hypothetical protein